MDIDYYNKDTYSAFYYISESAVHKIWQQMDPSALWRKKEWDEGVMKGGMNYVLNRDKGDINTQIGLKILK